MQKITRSMGLFLGLVMLSGGMVQAGSLADKKVRGAAEADLKDAVATVNTTCGTAIAATLDWATFAKAGTDHSIGGYCGQALSGVRQVCESSDDAKAAVKSSVKKFVCGYGGKGKRTAALKDGTLKYTVDWDSSNDTDFVREYLLNNL